MEEGSTQPRGPSSRELGGRMEYNPTEDDQEEEANRMETWRKVAQGPTCIASGGTKEMAMGA